jgi:hypothetical protein
MAGWGFDGEFEISVGASNATSGGRSSHETSAGDGQLSWVTGVYFLHFGPFLKKFMFRPLFSILDLRDGVVTHGAEVTRLGTVSHGAKVAASGKRGCSGGTDVVGSSAQDPWR